MLSTPGVGSGLDISGIISQLMAVERRPLVKLGTTQVELNTQLSAFGKLKSTLSVFKSAMGDLAAADKFKYAKATSSDADVLAASADATAAKGSYAIEVVRIAENHRLAAQTVFQDTDTSLVGEAGESMTVAVGTRSFTVDYGDKTLAQIRDAINAASNNTGVTASILQDDTGFRLTLAANEVGAANHLGITYAGADPVNPPDPFTLQALNQDRDGSGTFTGGDLDAVLRLENAFTVTRSSNTITDVVTGVTLNLGKPGAVSLTVARDDARIRGSVNQFISAYNDVMKTLTELRGSTLAEERGALRSLETQFRSILNSKAGTSDNFSFLFELGISTQRDGTLSLDASVFDSALANDPTGVADMFSGASSGLATRMNNLAADLIGAGGMLESRETTLNGRIRDIKTERATLEARLDRKEAALVDQFSALDALIAGLTTTSNFLTTQLDQIAQLNRSSKS